MIARKYPFKGADGSEIFAVTDGEYFTETLQEDISEAELYFEFYSDASGATVADPTGGTIASAGSPLGGNYLAAGSNSTTQASACGVEATYTPPVLDGLTVKGRITLASITGATHMRAVMFKHE